MKQVIQAPGVPPPSSGRTLRFWLGWLVVACVLPAWAATVLSIASSYQRERATLQASETMELLHYGLPDLSDMMAGRAGAAAQAAE